MKTLITIAALLTIAGVINAFAEPLQWQVPNFGTINLNVSTTEALVGYDAILKQSVGGVSLPVYTDPKQIITLQVGAVAPWPTNGPTVEPYIAAGHDILREIPTLSNYKSLHLNVFGRYASNQGKTGLGCSFSYSFAQ